MSPPVSLDGSCEPDVDFVRFDITPAGYPAEAKLSTTFCTRSFDAPRGGDSRGCFFSDGPPGLKHRCHPTPNEGAFRVTCRLPSDDPLMLAQVKRTPLACQLALGLGPARGTW